MSREARVTLTNMCMVRDGDFVLVQDRLDPDWPGLTFPGGHVEAGEAFTDAVIREVKEETGLTISKPRLCGIKDWINEDGSRYMVLLYQTECFQGQLKSSDEGEVFWLPLEEMKKRPMAHGMEKMLRVFLEDDISEEFFLVQNGKWLEWLK